MGFDLREFELGVVGVHFTDLFPGRSSKHFDDFNQLINARITGEDGLTEKELS